MPLSIEIGGGFFSVFKDYRIQIFGSMNMNVTLPFSSSPPLLSKHFPLFLKALRKQLYYLVGKKKYIKLFQSMGGEKIETPKTR